jgi:hypothetical protein
LTHPSNTISLLNFAGPFCKRGFAPKAFEILWALMIGGKGGGLQ